MQLERSRLLKSDEANSGAFLPMQFPVSLHSKMTRVIKNGFITVICANHAERVAVRQPAQMTRLKGSPTDQIHTYDVCFMMFEPGLKSKTLD